MKHHDTQTGLLAAQQYGLVSHEQARAVGMSQRQIDGWVRSGRWQAVARGVYRVAGVPTSWRQQTLTACLAAPPGAKASHFSAAALITAAAPPPDPHVTVAYGRSARGTVGVVHRSRVHPLDTTIVTAIPSTSPARTLVDCAGITTPERLATLVDEILHAGLTSPREIELAIERAGPRRRVAVLRSLLDPWRDGIEPGSPAEVRLVRQLIEWGFPQPETQIVIYDADGIPIARADVGWRAVKVGIEYDSRRWHGPSAWQHDEARHQAVVAAGWTLLHADKADLLPGDRSLRHALRRVWPAEERHSA
ncbi:MAG TPA: type IV toxin-antitoxin system AbiEi family antitoxin domain-containing protein [Acidimicrobiales bacterium]|nr:type IV toxin-antitoxin system AbiEi family antitoxin domain-containing protein [Acidimicrobiales bacterium]